MEIVHDAVAVATKATAHDTKGHLPEAVYLYSLAVKLLEGAIQSGALDQGTAATVRAKADEYRARGKEIVTAAQQKQQQSTPTRDPMTDPRVIAGMTAAESAVAADREGRTLEAVERYSDAARSFLAAAGDETLSVEARRALEEKATEYTVRSEKLRAHAITGRSAPGGAVPFRLAPGQTHYDNPVKEPGFLQRLGQKITGNSGESRIASSWLK